MEKKFQPFRDNGETREIDRLVIETQSDRIDIRGEISIARDKRGLAAALALKQVIDAAVELLKSEKLPDRVEEVPSKTIANRLGGKRN